MNKLTAHRKTVFALFLILFFAGLFGCAIGVPFSIAVLDDPAAAGPVDPYTVWLRALGEALFLLAPASVAGILLGSKVGLGAPILTGLITRAPGTSKQIRESLAPSIIVGIAIAVPGLIAIFTLPKDAFGPGMANPTPFEWLLRSLSAALTEEIFFRFGLMTLFVWIIRSILKKTAIKKPSLWIGNFLAALIFAGAHLPNILSSGQPDWNIVILVIVFNSLAGLIMGWLFIRYGLISAILAHFVADFVQYVIPRILS
jgi:hypothetical protein